MKLTEVVNPDAGIPDLDGIAGGIWHIDANSNLVIELEFIDDSGSLYFGYLTWIVEDNTLQGLDRVGAEEILVAPFKPINIKEIIFERID